MSEEHYKRVEAERDTLKAQVAELRSALQAMIKGRVSGRLPNAVHPSGRFCHVCGCNSTVQVHSHGCPVKLAEEVLASSNPGEEFLAKAKRTELLEQLLSIALDRLDLAAEGLDYVAKAKCRGTIDGIRKALEDK